MARRAVLVLGVLAGLAIGGTRAACAATIVVDTTADTIDGAGNCSLREAVRAANLDVAVDGCAAGEPGLDTITLGLGQHVLTAAGSNEDAALDGDLDVTDELAINGAGAGLTAIGAAIAERAFHVQPGASLTLSNLQISDGSESAGGGAVRVESGGSLHASDCRLIDSQALEGGAIDGVDATVVVARAWISGNEASGNGGGLHMVGGSLSVTDTAVLSNQGSRGGGIYSRDTVVTVTRSEIADNTATFEGGGLRIGGASDLDVRNTTITGNGARGAGGGLLVAAATNALLANVTVALNAADIDDPDGSHGGTGGGLFKSGSGVLTLRNTIIAGNTDEGSAPDCDASLIVSEGHNLLQDDTQCELTPLASDLLGVDPLLEALANNGGPTETLALAPTSPARDAGDPAVPGSGGTACEAKDQREVVRPLGAACDVGAFEAVPVPTATPTPSETPTPTLTASPTATATALPSAIGTATATPSATPTPSTSASPTPGPSVTPTLVPTPTPSASATPGCGPVPASGCRVAAVPGKGFLSLTDATRAASDVLAWTWAKGSVTTKAAFGDPLTTTGYDLCVYDAASTRVFRAHVESGGLCGTRPCWKATRRGFAYTKRLGAPDGVERITLTEGLVDGRAKIAVRAKGATLILPTLPLVAPLRVQLQNGAGTCWEASFSVPVKNDGHRFKARSDG